MTGKTRLISSVQAALRLDLMNPDVELSYKETPQRFWGELQAVPRQSLIVVDEIQKVPALLNYVQLGIEQLQHRFILSGSSARKLRRGAANLLGGRAIEQHLHPLSTAEIGEPFDLTLALSYGTLPKIYTLLLAKNVDEVRAVLGSYYTIYIQQEIQAEALSRNIPAFQRFLRVAAQSNGQIIEYANIGRQCQVDDSTVKGYFEILTDTLMGSFLYQWNASERKKARAKFYFFDVGVVRALQNRLFDPPTGQELGFLFESWFFQELIKLRDYEKPYLELSYWRDRDDEIDLICSHGEKRPIAIELKSGLDDEISTSTVAKFKAQFPATRLIVASRLAEHPRRSVSGIEILPWRAALAAIRAEV